MLHAARLALPQARSPEAEPRSPAALPAPCPSTHHATTTAVIERYEGDGVMTLTACGLGFLAGYASQSFFAYLDTVIGTVFPAGASTLATAAQVHSSAAPAALPSAAGTPTPVTGGAPSAAAPPIAAG